MFNTTQYDIQFNFIPQWAQLQAKAADLAEAQGEVEEPMASDGEEGDAEVAVKVEESCEEDSDGDVVGGSCESGSENGESMGPDDDGDSGEDDDETSPSQATTLVAVALEEASVSDDSQTFQTPEREKSCEPEDRFSSPVEVPKQFSSNDLTEMCITVLQYISQTHPDIAKYLLWHYGCWVFSFLWGLYIGFIICSEGHML